jgi:cytochrome c556
MSISLQITRIPALAAALALAALSLGAAGASQAQGSKEAEQAIAYRKAAYTVVYNNFGPLGAMASGKAPYDAKAFQLRADRVAFMATITPDVFPAVSKSGAPTKAKPEIWDNQAEFTKLMKDFTDKTAALAVAAKSNNLDTIKPAFGAAAGTCKACHDKYKAD